MAVSISAVIFDMYGTLTPSRPQAYWDAQKAASAQALGATAEAWIAALDATWAERLIGGLGTTTETFRKIAADLGLSPTDEQLAASVAARLEAYREVEQLRPDALPTLRALRAVGLKIALVSDCTGELPDLWAEFEFAPLFDATVFSSSEGACKPDPRLFRTAAERLGVTPEACLYVGDGGGGELDGAAGVGMHPVMLAGSDWSEHVAQGRPTDWTGPRVETLAEIPALVAQLAAG